MKWAGGGVAGNELFQWSAVFIYLLLFYDDNCMVGGNYFIVWGLLVLLLPNFLCLSRVFGGVYRTIKVSGTTVKL